MLANDFRHGKSITFSCDRGYSMMGWRRTVSCDDGRWSHNFPSCKGKIYREFITLGIVQDEHLSYESIHSGSISLLYNYFNLD